MSNKKIYNRLIVNISREGCFIETQKPFSVGEKFLMDIQLDGDIKSIRVKCEVTNANRMGMGIAFENVSGDLIRELGNLLYKMI